MSVTYSVIDSMTKEEQNFYDSRLPQALVWAKDCKRQMKSLTGREYEVVVKTETETLSLKDYEHTLGGKTN
jgi:hypothetical protein|tara:strand:- start:105 stop:317 length:213 start_codon:yes stop_codon:yes gene_type:complete